MIFSLQLQIELCNFDKVRNFLATLPEKELSSSLTAITHIHQVVRLDNAMPYLLREQILAGIVDIMLSYNRGIIEQEQVFKELPAARKEEYLYFFAFNYTKYKELKKNFFNRYTSGELSINEYAEYICEIGEAERHFKPFLHNLGIVDIDFS